VPALPDRRVRQRLTPTNGGGGTDPWRTTPRPANTAPYPCRGEAPPRPTAPPGAAIPQHERAHRDGNSTSSIGDGTMTGPAGRRVRQRLTPTNGGYRPTVAGRCGTGDASAHSCRGEALPRPPGGTPGNPPRPLTATHLCGRSPVCDPGHRESTPHTVDRRWRDGRPSGPAGQAAPDPDNTGRYHLPVGHSCLTGDVLASPAGTVRCIAQLRRRRRTASGRCPTPARQRTRWSGRRPESWPGTAMPTSARRLGTYSGVDHR
jgi:hypothetical protein